MLEGARFEFASKLFGSELAEKSDSWFRMLLGVARFCITLVRIHSFKNAFKPMCFNELSASFLYSWRNLTHGVDVRCGLVPGADFMTPCVWCCFVLAVVVWGSGSCVHSYTNIGEMICGVFLKGQNFDAYSFTFRTGIRWSCTFHFCHATFRFGTGTSDWFRGALKLGYLLVHVRWHKVIGIVCVPFRLENYESRLKFQHLLFESFYIT